MPDSRSINRSMFWRIERRLLSANRGRVLVILLALGAGAAVTAALLNLQVDAKRRLTTDFRSFGANALILPKDSTSTAPQTLPEATISSIPLRLEGFRVAAASSLYLVATVSSSHSGSPLAVVVVGARPRLPMTTVDLTDARPSPPAESGDVESACAVGIGIAKRLRIEGGEQLILKNQDRQEACRAFGIAQTGGPEDNQVIVGLKTAQSLASLPGRISLIQLSIPGTPQQIQNYIATLQQKLPDLDVRPIRQFTEGEARIYNRISGVLNATVAVILILTALCVMAAMTNIAMERKNDVALMKAIGGAARRVLRLFLIEATLLGFAGGLLGAAVGLFLSIWLGKAVFGVAAQPRFIVYPVSVALTVLVAILGAFPLRRLVAIRPAVIFRGGE